MIAITRAYRKALHRAIEFRWVTIGIAAAALALSGYLAMSGMIGSEFLPHLDEGAIWARATLAPSTGPTEGSRVMNQARVILASFPEVTQVVSQIGRPDDGTDTTGFFNTEYFVDLKPKNEWRPVFNQNKEELDRSHGSRVGKDPRRFVEFLPAYRRQHGGSGERRKRAAGHQDLRRRSQDARSQGRTDCQRNADGSGHRRPRPLSCDRPAQPGVCRGT